MKKLMTLIFVILSIATFAGRYQGGYVNGIWYPFYKNTPNEKKCLEQTGDGDEIEGCTPYGIISFKGDIAIIGVAEIKVGNEYENKMFLKVSDFKITDEEGNIYTPSTYPSEKKDKNGNYIPLFGTRKNDFMKHLKDKNLKLKYSGKNWEEDYYVSKSGGYVAPASVVERMYSKKELEDKDFVRKKIKFLGVEKIKINSEITTSTYYTDENYLCVDFTGNVEGC